MKIYNLTRWHHNHDFHVTDRHSERRTFQVVALTLIMMFIEITAGILYGSMALLADGWHMGTHAGAIGITLFAYRYARKHAGSGRYTFGTGKVGVLGGYTSAVILAVVALLLAAESVRRIFLPVAIRFNEAILVAAAGLIVNLLSAFLLKGKQRHHHRGKGPHDHNLKAAYLHVLADALTSLLAIIALLFGKTFGWIWMDPAMGITGSVVIFRWAFLLIRDTGGILLDSGIDSSLLNKIRKVIESGGDNRVTDLHIWKVGPGNTAAVISIAASSPRPPEHYKKLLEEFGELTHVTIEVNPADSIP
jgi:cation diffusion facilitator family transporter